jgi:hypothetical protein
MILVLLVKVIVNLFFAVVNLLPRWTSPSAVTPGGSVTSALASLGASASGLGAWIDVPQFAAAITVIAGALASAAIIWAARKVLSLATFGKVA